ncbi:hypothetical protein Cni_G27492 [Canna indica]|uniref:ZF-HD dimerization-type domain-containing protein n=1 Tax=Canna indica TaxID=4628 RepID=A0AAQ3L1R5_9LILI|nr:hypothetical protein Cni_G27492 [Canna indica]
MGLQHDPRKASSNGHAPVKKDTTTSLVVVRYMECRKNHAAGIGGYALDGCREFMASGRDGTSDALKCAACSCHRSFHRRLVQTLPPPPQDDHDPSSSSSSWN